MQNIGGPAPYSQQPHYKGGYAPQAAGYGTPGHQGTALSPGNGAAAFDPIQLLTLLSGVVQALVQLQSGFQEFAGAGQSPGFAGAAGFGPSPMAQSAFSAPISFGSPFPAAPAFSNASSFATPFGSPFLSQPFPAPPMGFNPLPLPPLGGSLAQNAAMQQLFASDREIAATIGIGSAAMAGLGGAQQASLAGFPIFMGF